MSDKARDEREVSENVTVADGGPNHRTEYRVGELVYYFSDDETPDYIRTMARHYVLVAMYLESDAQQERLRLKARRKAIADKYKIETRWAPESIAEMIDRIIELEDLIK